MERRAKFVHPTTEALFRYWNKRRGTRAAPDRSEIEPGDIREILPDTFILEVEDGRAFHWRLAGTRVCALHCRELKGRDFLRDWHGRDRDSLTSLLAAVVAEQAVATLQVELATDRAQTLATEMVLLPLRVFGRPTCRILGALAPLHTPYWVGMLEPTRRTITGVRMTWPSAGDAAALSEPAPVRSTPSLVTEGLPASLGARRYRHLAVVDGGKA